MKPVIQVEKHAGWDSEREKVTDLRRVALQPSHEDGHFVIEDSFYGKVVVDKVVLLRVSEEDKTALEATDEFPLDRYVATGADGMSVTTGAQVNVPFNCGSGNSVNITVATFREFAPMAPEVARA